MRQRRDNQRGQRHKLIVKKSPLHGRGVFATATIRKNCFIGIYEGVNTTRDGTHVLWVEDDRGIDGRNELRFVNHSRLPNAVFYGDELWSVRTIRRGDEITHDYGADWRPPRKKSRGPA